MDDISAMLGLGIDDAQKTQMLADSLRGRKDAADRFALSTIGNIAGGAQGEQKAIMAGAAQAGGLRKAQQAREQAAEQARLNRALQSEEGRLGRESREGIASQGLLNAVELQRLKNEGDVNDTLDTRTRELEGDLKSYSKEFQKTNIPRVEESVKAVDRLLSALPVDKKTGKLENIPGVGYLANIPYAGGAFTLAEDAITPNKEGVPTAAQIRAARQEVFNQLIKLQSGAAVTLPEMLRNQIALGSEVWSSEGDFLAMWPLIKKGIEQTRLNYERGYGPEVVDIYNRRSAGEDLKVKDYLRSEAATPEAPDYYSMTDEELDAAIAAQQQAAQ
jgi:hypothetical protein